MLDNSAIHTKMHMLLRLFGEISCSYILEYWIIENTPLYVGLKRLFGLFEEKTKWEAFSKCPRNLRMYREIEMAQAWIMMCMTPWYFYPTPTHQHYSYRRNLISCRNADNILGCFAVMLHNFDLFKENIQQFCTLYIKQIKRSFLDNEIRTHLYV